MAENTRTTVVAPAPSVEAIPTGTEGDTLELVQENGTNGPAFISEHTLLSRVDSLADLPSGTIVVRGADGKLLSMRTDKIPSEKQTSLHAAIQAGTVYCLSGYRRMEFEELDAGWPSNTHPRVQKARLRALRCAPPKLERVGATDTD